MALLTISFYPHLPSTQQSMGSASFPTCPWDCVRSCDWYQSLTAKRELLQGSVFVRLAWNSVCLAKQMMEVPRMEKSPEHNDCGDAQH